MEKIRKLKDWNYSFYSTCMTVTASNEGQWFILMGLGWGDMVRYHKNSH